MREKSTEEYSEIMRHNGYIEVADRIDELLSKVEEMQKTLTIVRDTLEHKKNDDRTSWSLWNACNEALKGVETK